MARYLKVFKEQKKRKSFNSKDLRKNNLKVYFGKSISVKQPNNFKNHCQISGAARYYKKHRNAVLIRTKQAPLMSLQQTEICRRILLKPVKKERCMEYHLTYQCRKNRYKLVWVKENKNMINGLFQEKNVIALYNGIVLLLILLFLISGLEVTKKVKLKKIYITKRNMMSRSGTAMNYGSHNIFYYTNNVLFRGEPVLKTYYKKSPMTTLAGVVRKKAEKGLPPPLEYKSDGRIIYYDNDYSGHAHSAVIDLDSITKDGWVLIYGNFTSKNKTYQGQKPIEIDTVTFDGKPCKQYIYPYKNGRWAKLSDLKFSENCHNALKNNPIYAKVGNIVLDMGGPELDKNIKVADAETVLGFLGKFA